MSWLGGSDSTSNNSSTNKQSQLTTNVGDYGNTAGAKTTLAASVTDVSGGLSINMLDGGAVAGSLALGGRAIDSASALADQALQNAEGASQRETETAMFALQKANVVSGSIDWQSAIKYGAILGGVALVVYFLRGK